MIHIPLYEQMSVFFRLIEGDLDLQTYMGYKSKFIEYIGFLVG